MNSILPKQEKLQQHHYLEIIFLDKFAHKILHTCEKIDTINPTFEQIALHRYLLYLRRKDSYRNTLIFLMSNVQVRYAHTYRYKYGTYRCVHNQYSSVRLSKDTET